MPSKEDLKYPSDIHKRIPYFKLFMSRYSDSNYGQKRNILLKFVYFIENNRNKAISNTNVNDVLAYFKTQIEPRDIKRITKKKYRSVLNSYFSLFKEMEEKQTGKIVINPVPSHHIFDFSEKEIAFDELEREDDVLDDYLIVDKILNYLYFTRKRLFIIVSLLLYTGARISEVCRIQLNHIDFKERFFYVKVKSKKALNRWSIYFFPEFFIPYLREWIDELRLEIPRAKYLFQKGSRSISTNTPRKHLRALKNELGFTYNINPHAFRDFINTERFDRDLNKKYRKLLLSQTPKDVNIKNYLKKYKKRKKLQEIYDKTFPFPEFKPKLKIL